MRALENVILKLPPGDLEFLIHGWASGLKHRYHSSDLIGQANDRGLDVAAFETAAKFEGSWHNYQCKQLSRTLGEPALFGELGKTLYYASRGEFSAPSEYVFVAPKGVSQPARVWLGQPSKLKKAMLDEWDTRCAGQITAKGDPVPMDDDLRAVIEAFDFTAVDAWKASRILLEESMQPVLVKLFEIDPGAAPEHPVPADIQGHESTYVDQLVGVYGDHSGSAFPSVDAVLQHAQHGVHLRDQRVRYFAAADFKAFFKESVLDNLLSEIDESVYHGVVDGLHALTGLARIDAAMSKAAVLQVPGPFGKHGRATIKVRQGTCHHLVNDGRLKWRP